MCDGGVEGDGCLFCSAGGQTYGQGVDVDDHEVKGHGEGHGGHQPAVAPGGHAHQGLVLRQAGVWVGGGRWGWMGRRRGTLMQTENIQGHMSVCVEVNV